ncbi:Putative auto-transporter adhesin, head GIN domain [Formosa sp. Hel1_31_208]|uniref:head GIN domain-containing protein n=1 Tax=Formosa sp. Hel1_31_208 TaxID=1798225 RepID=UPI00087BB6C7|nr:head GIN domain-containing protein [Formosa sp. Hel1_31_208]SDS28006.1 Putative auto-transporter adhesin, head GIN domain [Formosa sp. Hel1_31_208]
MKKSLVLVIALLCFSISQAQWKKVKGNGEMTKQKRSTGDYDAIKCAGSFDYILVSGTEGNITIEGESNLLEHIVTEVKDGTLHVKTQKGKNLSTSWNKTITITIPFQDIDNVSLSGSGDLWNKDRISTSTLDVSLSGSGDIVLDIQTQRVTGKVTGSGDLTLKGSTTDLKAGVTGSGDFHGFNLQSTNTDVYVKGSGDAEVVCNGVFKARVTGSGDIEYRGNPKTEDTKVSGSGSIEN